MPIHSSKKEHICREKIVNKGFSCETITIGMFFGTSFHGNSELVLSVLIPLNITVGV